MSGPRDVDTARDRDGHGSWASLLSKDIEKPTPVGMGFCTAFEIFLTVHS
jgi:hypothetical protein